MAKVGLIIDFNLSIPNISTGITKHHGLFNPEIVNILKKDNKEYQKIDIEYNNKLPKLITGSNMGGKSLTLKTLALSQIMFQFGLGVPSENSSISIVDDIEFIYGDQEDYSAGLSSFAAEIKRLDGLISRLSNQQNLLVLIDEPARTTNPLEGTALVSSLIKIISEFNCFCVITTHYHIKNANCDRIRVVGFDNGKMNYSLIDDCGKSIPMEALKIASYLGINNKWLNIAYKELETNNNNI
jgi:dsDNA-specific endonuclease/ATPase MutS2